MWLLFLGFVFAKISNEPPDAPVFTFFKVDCAWYLYCVCFFVSAYV